MNTLRVTADYYQQFDVDFDRDVSAEGYGGWNRCAEFIPRADEICRTVLPPLRAAVRKAGLTLIHVVSSKSYCQHYPGYQRAVALAGPEPVPPEPIPSDPIVDSLWKF
ncbi:MAG: hypothetical protein KKG09_07130 [Verrucomicrobia bacterium]|nr:hypothetical protein [Verrucomicrobiota bacterium]MCG2679216.1 hypothetical protein [Kiritimatiellia bacterium]MBU4248609.1 hypothetical protein [Verrucomicrobiota bacterium]MBU4290071.1 hypothetical protein [Verrucomicrobiota bacterium]MBU4430347.1 hypothetical protein [Verrucomicrobiota bacterium]